jgi:hypothetical protein
LQCYCVIGAHPSLFGNPEAAGDSIIPTPASEQNEGIDKALNATLNMAVGVMLRIQMLMGTPGSIQTEKSTP